MSIFSYRAVARRLWRLLLPCALLFGRCAAAPPPVPPPLSPPPLSGKNLLLLYSYGYGGRGVEKFNQSLLATLKAAGIGVDHIYAEYLDLERNRDDPQYRARLQDLLAYKYAQRHIDLLLTVQQPALDFLLREGRDIAPGAPAITGQAPAPDAAAAHGRRLVSELAHFDIKGTLERALELFPKTRRVLFVAGRSEADQRVAQEALRVARPWAGKLAIETTGNLSLAAMLARVAHLPPRSIVIFTQYNRDAEGRATLAYEVERQVVKAAAAPVFGLYDFNLEDGGIGGSVISVTALGEQTGQLALALLSGKFASGRQVTEVRSRAVPVFDWPQIERWGGDPRRLPKNSVFVGREPSLWQRDRELIVGVGLVILAQTLLLAALLVNRRQRKLAELRLSESEKRFRTLVEHAPDAIVVYDVDLGLFVDANAQAEELFGCNREALLSRGPEDFYPAGQFEGSSVAEGVRSAIARTMAGEPVLIERLVRNARGRDLSCEVRLIGLPSSGRRLLRASYIDITERRAAEAKIRRLTQLYAALSQCNQAIVRCVSEEALFPQICRDAVRFGGIKMAWIGMVDPDGQRVRPVSSFGEGADYLEGIEILLAADPAARGLVASAIRDNQPFWCQDFPHDPRTAPWHERAATYGWGSMAALPLTRGGVAVGAFALYSAAADAFDQEARDLLTEMAADISFALDSFAHEAERRRAEGQLQLAAKVYEQSTEGIIITDARRNIVSVNRAFTEITGYSEAEVLGRNPNLLSSGRQDADFYRAMWQAIDEQGSWAGEIWNRRKNGGIYPEWLSISRLVDAGGATTHYIGIFSDITQHKAADEHIHWLAHFDALTGLPNRVLLADRSKRALGQAQRSGESVALMFLDLDRFKNINDTLGHRVGDALLIEVGKRLSALVRAQDTVSRSGGDEFILILPETDADGAAHLAEKLIEAATLPYRVEQYELNVSASIGIAVYPDDGEEFDALLKCADTAMYGAKRAGRNGFNFYTSEMQSRAARIMQLENALRRAIDGGQLQLHYQAQGSLRDGRVIGAEALLRWRHPELGMIAPAEFIPLAEESGQILAIGEWVLKTAVRQCKDWLDGGLGEIVIAVNLSAVQFRHPRLPELIMKTLDEAGLPPRYLELELTEGITLSDPLGAIAVMNRLHEQGVRMSIDDFGTGYSSLSYLKRFKVYKLKIDRSFVRDIAVDADDKAIVGAIISLADSLGLKTIAEGVETEEQRVYLRDQGCDEIQGYLYSHPLPAGEFEAFVRGRLSYDAS